MSPLSRWQLLALGAAGAVGGAGLWWTSGGGEFLGDGRELVQPEMLTGRDGVLDLALEAAPAEVRIGARTAHVQAYNGLVPGPTLRVRPGGTLRVAMTNGLEAPTNLHVHGLHVPPRASGDNPFVSIGPGESFDDEFVLPDDHPPGTYWYHPHHHGHVADQLAAGLYGVIVVEDPDPVPVARERVLVVSDLTLDGSGDPAEVSPPQRMTGREGETVLVNGQVRPVATAAPGERELWRVVNACPSRYLRLALDGQELRRSGRDAGRLTEPVDLLTFQVTGDRVGDPGPVPPGPSLRDLRDEPLGARRTLDFAMGMGMGGMTSGMRGPGAMRSFTIDGREFDPERTDQRVRVGTVEEWTLVDSSPHEDLGMMGTVEAR